MILLDTSVLVDFLRGSKTVEAQKFTAALDQQIPFGLCPLVYQEVLMGARDETEWQTLDSYLSTQRFYDVTQDRDSYRDAARIYSACCRRGRTIRSTVGCIIAQIAIEHGLFLLSKDRDYQAMTDVCTLQLW